MTQKPIRVGVVGVGRGQSFARGAAPAGMELVALCDVWEERLQTLAAQMKVAAYTDYQRFLEHDMDAVVLANFFHEHAPFAIAAMNAGKHVMSETSACLTLAQGVQLARTVERTGRVYMLAENYPYMAYNQEMRKLYREGFIGDFRYGEGEYIHPDPADIRLGRACGMDHWRNWIPTTYYCTHSIAPVMFITDTRPVKVNGFVVPYDHQDPTKTRSMSRADTAGVILCRMDNGAIMKSLHGGLRGHGNYTRIHGNRGLMENVRLSNSNAATDVRLRTWREPWEKNPDEPVERIYRPEFPSGSQHASKAGHGGGDYFTNHHFAQAIRTGTPPFLDVYRAIDMSICGILAWRSAVHDSAPQVVPDFRQESVRRQYEDDHWSPQPGTPAEYRAPSALEGEIGKLPQDIAHAREVWASKGYQES